MILQKEVRDLAQKWEVPSSTVDKDWVLGHWLNALYKEESCQQEWIFKGGTCLKKCYYADYRFSEDLDFTHLNPDFVLDSHFLEKIAKKIEDEIGIRFFVEKCEALRHKEQKVGYQAHIKFWGANHSKNEMPLPAQRWQTSIKIELIHYEKMLFDVEKRKLVHLYSDQNIVNSLLPCYSLYEVLSEKLRALFQRKYTAPRDYYDIWYLSQHEKDLDWEKIVWGFSEKMSYKGLLFDSWEKIIGLQNQKTLSKHWKSSIAHHISDKKLPSVDKVLEDLGQLFQKIQKK